MRKGLQSAFYFVIYTWSDTSKIKTRGQFGNESAAIRFFYVGFMVSLFKQFVL